MSPYEIKILLHYHAIREDHELAKETSDLACKTFGRFLDSGFLEKSHNDMIYSPTEKLHVYVDALCNVPEPVQKWVIEGE